MDDALRLGAILLEKYRIDGVLGQGGMGVVVKVTHLQLDEELAMKVLTQAHNPDAHARFLQEAQSVVRLRGEHVTRVTDVGVLPTGAPFMVMEYLRGSDLAGELLRRGPLPPGEAVDYVLQACEALAEAHARGIVHRDIKPGNLFLTQRPDGSPLVKVLDFGISKDPIHVGSLTRTQAVMGTPGYMSPEQMKAARDVDARSDVWSLGAVLYECLMCQRPFEADSFSGVVFRVATEPPTAMDPRIPRGLQAVILRCLEKDRDARMPTAAALAQALAPFARDPLAAALAVERTQLLARSASLPIEAMRSRTDAPTTLSSATGVSQAAPRNRRFAMIGMVAGALAIPSLVVAALHGRSEGVAASAAMVPAPPPAAMTPPVAPAVIAPAPEPVVTAPAPEPVAPEAVVTAPAPETVAPEPVAAAPAPPAKPASACEASFGDLLSRAQHQYTAGDARDALKTMRQALACGHSAPMYQRAGLYACAALDATAAKLYFTKTSPDLQPAVAQKCQQAGIQLDPRFPVHTPCVLPIDELKSRADMLAARGDARSALSTINVALSCAPDVSLYMLATRYACAAHDLPKARDAFAHVPERLRTNLALQCDEWGVSLTH